MRPHFLRTYSNDWPDTMPAEPLLHLHRVTLIQPSEAANDMDAEDELLADCMTSLELLAIAFGLVFAIAASIYQPWQWF